MDVDVQGAVRKIAAQIPELAALKQKLLTTERRPEVRLAAAEILHEWVDDINRLAEMSVDELQSSLARVKTEVARREQLGLTA